MIYCFHLGRTFELSKAELEAVLSRFGSYDLTSVNDTTVLVQKADGLDATKLMSILGGTIKISEVVKTLENTAEEAIQDDITKYLIENKGEGKLVFSVASVNVDNSTLPDQDSVKDRLKNEGISTRYLEARRGLGAAQLTHHNIIELQFLKHDEKLHLLRTRAIQDIDDWSARDFGKPYRDPKKGMLPPKLARMMVNLSIGDRKPAETALLDPFCGTGTVLMEASMVGVTKVYGADLDRDAVIGSGKNMDWFTKNDASQGLTYDLSVQDVMQITTKEKVDCIVTEPFLGKPNPKEHAAPNQLKGLEKQYLGMLKAFKKVLKPNGTVTVVFPAYAFEDRVKTLNAVIDRLEDLGYTREKGPFRYSRPQTVVQRDIFTLRLR